jgi:hypothetical protein
LYVPLLTGTVYRLLGAMLVEGASDTTPSVMHWLVIMLTAFPDVQRRLHDEIDRVVGRERVPRPDDFERLPYLQASVSRRWLQAYVDAHRPVAGLPQGDAEAEARVSHRRSPCHSRGCHGM